MSLNGSAFNLDGSLAARVSAAGSNRTQLRNGLATFKAIRVQAREEGEYKLTVGSHSKKIAIQEAAVIVKVRGDSTKATELKRNISTPKPWHKEVRQGHIYACSTALQTAHNHASGGIVWRTR